MVGVKIGPLAGILVVIAVSALTSSVPLLAGGISMGNLEYTLSYGAFLIVLGLGCGMLVCIPAYLWWRAAAERQTSRAQFSVKTGLSSAAATLVLSTLGLWMIGMARTLSEVVEMLAATGTYAVVAGLLYGLASWVFTEG